MYWFSHNYQLSKALLAYYLTIHTIRCMEHHPDKYIANLFDDVTHNWEIILDNQTQPPDAEVHVGHESQNIQHFHEPGNLWRNQETSSYQREFRAQAGQTLQIQPGAYQDMYQNQLHTWNSYKGTTHGYECSPQLPRHISSADFNVYDCDPSSHVDLINNRESLNLNNQGTNNIHLESSNIHSFLDMDSHWTVHNQITTPEFFSHGNIYSWSDTHPVSSLAPITHSLESAVGGLGNPIAWKGKDFSSGQLYNNQDVDSSTFQMFKDRKNEVSPPIVSFENLHHTTHMLCNWPSETVGDETIPSVGGSPSSLSQAIHSDRIDEWDDILNLSASLLSSTSPDNIHNNKRVSETMRMDKLKCLKSSLETNSEGRFETSAIETPQLSTSRQPMVSDVIILRKPKKNTLRKLHNFLAEKGRGMLLKYSDLGKSNGRWLNEWKKRYQISLDNLQFTESVTDLIRKDLHRVKNGVKDRVLTVFLGLIQEIDASEHSHMDRQVLLGKSLAFIQAYLDSLSEFDSKSLQEIDLQIPLGSDGLITPIRILYEISLCEKKRDLKFQIYYHIWKAWRVEMFPSVRIPSYFSWLSDLKDRTLEVHSGFKTSSKITRKFFPPASISSENFDRVSSRTYVLRKGRFCIEAIMVIHKELREFFDSLNIELLSMISGQAEIFNPAEMRHYKSKVENSTRLLRLSIVPSIFGVLKIIFEHCNKEMNLLATVLQDVWLFLKKEFSLLQTLDLEYILLKESFQIDVENIEAFQEPEFISNIFKHVASGTIDSNFKPVVWSLLKQWKSSSSKSKSNFEYVDQLLEKYNDKNFTGFVQDMALP
ncbi:hypothetical protein DFH28DRAFT_577992 [Melampsora americana]|nr:hypothetical protein DFH28DRAFT_577992 [Melampsora americana]